MHLSSFLKCRLGSKPSKIYLSILPFAMLCFNLAGSRADAAQVSKANAKQVVLKLDGAESLTVGQRMVVMVGGKKKAIVEISKVQGSQALASIVKATPGSLVGGTAVILGGGSSGGDNGGGSTKSASRRGKRRSGGAGPLGDLTVGGLLGYSMDSQAVNGSPMTGSGISLKGFADVPISGGLGAVARAGFEQFSASGTVNNLNAKTTITYLTTDLLIRYSFTKAAFSPFVAGGLGIHFPLSKTSSNALDVAKISATTVFLFNGGANYVISDTMYVQGLLEYGMFPPSNSVSTHFISLRGGVGFRF